jgi:hypothetical protein
MRVRRLLQIQRLPLIVAGVARVWRYLLSELCFSRQFHGYTLSSLLDEFLWHRCAAFLYHVYSLNAQSYLIFHPGCGDLYEEAVRSPSLHSRAPRIILSFG